MSVIGGRPRAGTAPRSPLGQPRRLAGVPSTSTRPWVRGSGWYAKGSRTGHFVMFILSYKARAAYGGCTWEAEGPVQGLCGRLCGRPPRQTRRPVPPGTPLPSRTVGEHNIGFMTIYWIWLKSYLHTP